MKPAPFVSLALLLSAHPAVAADPAAGQAVFAQRCAPCHSIGGNDTSNVGPPLDGVIGRGAGAAPGFTHYSLPMGIFGWRGAVWTPANLHAYISKPSSFLPGTKMTFFGIASAEQRQDILAYLASFPAE